jgi:hypothetical protein
MGHSTRTRRLILVLAGTVTLTGSVLAAPACAAPRGRIYVQIGPPPPVVERVVVAPAPGYIWVPGYYSWSGVAYVWVPGRHALAPRPRAVWVPGRWVRERRGWYWVEGRWR